MKKHKKDAYYFSHDSNAQDDPKCMLLIEQLGMEGYGIYWSLVEKLRNEPSGKLPLIIVPALATRWRVSKEKVETVIKKFGLFIVENELFFSLRLLRSIKQFQSSKKRLSESGLKGNKIRWSKGIAIQSPPDSKAIATQSQVKEKKEKEKKENEIVCEQIAHTHKIFSKKVENQKPDNNHTPPHTPIHIPPTAIEPPPHTHTLYNFSLNLPNINKMNEHLTNEQCVELEKQYSTADIQSVLRKMNNYATIHRRNSVYTTCLEWLSREEGVTVITKNNRGLTPKETVAYYKQHRDFPAKTNFKKIFTTLPLSREQKLQIPLGEEEGAVREYFANELREG